MKVVCRRLDVLKGAIQLLLECDLLELRVASELVENLGVQLAIMDRTDLSLDLEYLLFEFGPVLLLLFLH